MPISYHSFLCISISVVVPSDNSSLYVGVEHCVSKLQAVKEFDRGNGLNHCRQHEVTFTRFTRYPFLQFAYCIEFISKTSSVSLLLTMQRALQIGELPNLLLCFIEQGQTLQQNHCLETWSTCQFWQLMLTVFQKIPLQSTLPTTLARKWNKRKNRKCINTKRLTAQSVHTVASQHALQTQEASYWLALKGTGDW